MSQRFIELIDVVCFKKLKLLKDSWRFDDLVGDFRYGLKGGVEFSPERIASSLRALKSLEYQDNKIVKEAVLKVILFLS